MRQMNARRRNYRKTGLSTFSIVMTLLLCVSMVAGTTLAYFTDYISVGNNVIQSGRLDAELYTSADPKTNSWANAETAPNALFNYEYWEPGYTDLKFVKVKNAGNLSFQYELNIIPKGETEGVPPTPDQTVLMNAIDVYTFDIKDAESYTLPTSFDKLLADYQLRGSMAELASDPGRIGNFLLADESDVLGIALHMRETAGNEYQDKSAGDGFDVQLLATQYTYEKDSFGKDYDAGAAEEYLHLSAYASASIVGKVDGEGKLFEEITLVNSDKGIRAVVPAGAKIADGVETLTLVVRPLSKSNSDVKPGENETMFSIDVHVDGLAADNTVPALITIPEALSTGLNMGNYSLYHVEDGVTKAMTHVLTAADLDVHNEFSYDPATGDVTMALASFSEVALVADTEAVWEGAIAEEFAGGAGTEADPYIIANADQLAYMNDCVSNDNASYGDKYYKLIADVNIGGESNWTEKKVLFYPIGYLKKGDGMNTADEEWYTYGGAFSGTFDGAGHTISGIYQNTWAMDGDYDNGYYNDAMGLFGYISGGTVKNLTICTGL